MRVQPIVNRLYNSTVVWSWAFNFLRLASGVLLLPLLLGLLSKPDLGMYYVFLGLNGLVAVLDLGFSPTIGRFINYAMGGAKQFSAQGLSSEPPHGEPNLPLLWELMFTARVFYRYLVLAIVLLLGTFGSLMVWHTAETDLLSRAHLAGVGREPRGDCRGDLFQRVEYLPAEHQPDTRRHAEFRRESMSSG